MTKQELAEQEIKSAKAVLEKHGYAVKHLWHEKDITYNYEVGNENALDLMNGILKQHKDYIKDSIEEVAQDLDLEPKN